MKVTIRVTKMMAEGLMDGHTFATGYVDADAPGGKVIVALVPTDQENTFKAGSDQPTTFTDGTKPLEVDFAWDKDAIE